MKATAIDLIYEILNHSTSCPYCLFVTQSFFYLSHYKYIYKHHILSELPNCMFYAQHYFFMYKECQKKKKTILHWQKQYWGMKRPMI